MEGFLMKQGGGESTFGRKTWKKRWFVLDSYEMTYYEDFDLRMGKPFDEKGVYNVKGCKVELVDDRERKFLFNIISQESKKTFNLQALDERTLNLWVKAIEAASEGNFGRIVIDYEPFFDMLGLDKEEPLTTSAVNKAYRKLALKMHPDKGGDIMEFKKLQDASDALLNKIEEEEREMEYDTHYIDACIIKGPPGIGFGMIVVEDTKYGAVTVKSVMPTMQLVRISPDPEEKIMPGDRLVMIGADDISLWAMGRIVQRLSDFRVPVGTEIQLRFSRKVRIDGMAEPLPYTEPNESTTSSYIPTPTYHHETSHDVDIDEEESEADDAHSEEHIIPTHDFFQKTNDFYRKPSEEEPPVVPPSSSAAAAAEPPRQSRRRSSYLRYENISDPVIKASILAEMDELKYELEDTKKLLQFANEERSKYAHDVTNLRANAEVARYQAEYLKRQLDESRLREKYLELQLQQAMMQNEASTGQVMQSMKDMIRVSNALQMGKSLPPATPEVRDCMLSMKLPVNDSTNDRRQNARRVAALAVGSIDPSGILMKKWSLSGVSLVDKLARLEEKLAKVQYAEQKS